MREAVVLAVSFQKQNGEGRPTPGVGAYTAIYLSGRLSQDESNLDSVCEAAEDVISRTDVRVVAVSLHQLTHVDQEGAECLRQFQISAHGSGKFVVFSISTRSPLWHVLKGFDLAGALIFRPTMDEAWAATYQPRGGNGNANGNGARPHTSR